MIAHLMGDKVVFVEHERLREYQPSLASKRRLCRTLNKMKAVGQADIWPDEDGFIAHVDRSTK